MLSLPKTGAAKKNRWLFIAIKNTIAVQQVIKTLSEYKEPKMSSKNACNILSQQFFQVYPHFYVENCKIIDLLWHVWNIKFTTAHIFI